jgi:hypothetical protein
MKRLIAAAALLSSACAMAAGAFDGVYQNTANSEHFYTVHQNGSTMLLGAFGTITTDGNIYLKYGAYQFRPPKLYPWDVQTGQLDGARAIMTGGTMQNACTVTYQLDFGPGTLTATMLRVEQRLGGVPCAELIPPGTVVTAFKIF